MLSGWDEKPVREYPICSGCEMGGMYWTVRESERHLNGTCFVRRAFGGRLGKMGIVFKKNTLVDDLDLVKVVICNRCGYKANKETMDIIIKVGKDKLRSVLRNEWKG